MSIKTPAGAGYALAAGIAIAIVVAIAGILLIAPPPSAAQLTTPLATPTVAPPQPTPTPAGTPAPQPTISPPQPTPTPPHNLTPTPSPNARPERCVYAGIEWEQADAASNDDAVTLAWHSFTYDDRAVTYTYRLERAAPDSDSEWPTWTTLAAETAATGWTDRPGAGQWIYRVGIVTATAEGVVYQCDPEWIETEVTVLTAGERADREAKRQALTDEMVRCAIAGYTRNISAAVRPVVIPYIDQIVRGIAADYDTPEAWARWTIIFCAGDYTETGGWMYLLLYR